MPGIAWLSGSASFAMAAAWSMVLAASLPAPASAQTVVAAKLADLTLEQLGNIEITSASKRSERLSDAPTSIFVITADDIRRAGAVSLPEALRLAPNLQVARSSNEGYSISARGVDSALSNKLLVMIDGRSIYTPLYSGVFWDVQDVMLEDIDRIEVISGPGGTVWGVNAVNGVINIIMRPAAQRQGSLASAEVGEGSRRISVRHGGTTAAGLAYSVYALGSEFSHSETANGASAQDAARHTQAGFRADLSRGTDTLTLSGDVYDGWLDQPPGLIGAQPTTQSGGDVLGRWERRAEDGGGYMLQAYVDHTQRTSEPIFSDTQDIVDVQGQRTMPVAGRHRLTWGGQYRLGRDRVANSTYLAFLPPTLVQHWASLFVQDEIQLGEDVALTLGLRAEHNDYTGLEYLPAVRLAWNAAAGHLVWAAVSRSVRAPARLDRDFHVPGAAPFVLDGGPNFQSEVADDVELGYRGQVDKSTTVSATAFATRFDRLRSLQLDADSATYHLANDLRARTSGLELWGSHQAQPNWRLHAGLGLLHQHAWLAPGSTDTTSIAAAEGGNPSRWWLLRSSLDLGDRVEFDVVLRGVGARQSPAVPSYNAMDLRLGWAASQSVQLSIGARNLIGGGHAEFGSAAARSEFKPAAYAKLELRL
jgi:iron complex outermembrane receptor protein